MTAKTGKYSGDQLFHTISHDKNPTTVQFIYFPYHKVKATQVLNGLTCILSEELLIKPNDFITISGVDRSTMGIWGREKRTFTEPNELYNEESTEGILEGTGITALDLDHYPKAMLKNKMGNFDEEDIHKANARAQGKYDETVTIASRSRQMGRKLQSLTKTAPTTGFNIAPSEDPPIKSGLTQEAVEDEDISLLGRASLALYSAGDDISLLGDNNSLIGNGVYPPEYVSLGY